MDKIQFRMVLMVIYVGGEREDFDSLPCSTRNQALETAMNLMWAALEDNHKEVMAVTGHSTTIRPPIKWYNQKELR